MRNKRILIVISFFFYVSISACVQQKVATTYSSDVKNTFNNPVINGADPFVFQKDGFYYYLHTMATSISLWKTEDITNLKSSTSKTVFSPKIGTQNSKSIWAPELFFLDGKWYIYYTAGDGNDVTQRTWVLENSNADPMQGEWIDKGKISSDGADFWAIDGTVLEVKGTRYFLWSGRPGSLTGNLTQNIYISKMSNPWTLEAEATLLSTPEFTFEKKGFGVNEGPEIIKNKKKEVFLIYSASYCGTDDYSLGQLRLKKKGNPLIKDDWIKSENPVFSKSPENNAFGPGHNSFFTSPDGKENWIIYHANTLTNQGCSNKRNTRMQKFTFNKDGSPNFGVPLPIDKPLTKPSGTK